MGITGIVYGKSTAKKCAQVEKSRATGAIGLVVGLGVAGLFWASPSPVRASEVSADRALIEQKSKLAHELKLEKRLLLGFRTSNGQIIEGQIATLSQDIATLSDINVTAIASELLAEVGRMGERALIAIVMKKVATAVQPAPLAAATELTRAQRILAYGTNALNGYQVVTGL